MLACDTAVHYHYLDEPFAGKSAVICHTKKGPFRKVNKKVNTLVRLRVRGRSSPRSHLWCRVFISTSPVGAGPVLNSIGCRWNPPSNTRRSYFHTYSRGFAFNTLVIGSEHNRALYTFSQHLIEHVRHICLEGVGLISSRKILLQDFNSSQAF